MKCCDKFTFVRPAKDVGGEKYTHEHVEYRGHYANIVDVLDCEKNKVGFVTNEGLKSNCGKTINTGYLPIKPAVDFICDRYTPDLSDYNNAVKILYKPIDTYGITFSEAHQLAKQGFAITKKTWYKTYLWYSCGDLITNFTEVYHPTSKDISLDKDWCLCDTRYFLDFKPEDVFNDQLEAMFDTNHEFNGCKDVVDYDTYRNLIRQEPLHELFHKPIPKSVVDVFGCLSESNQIITMLTINNFLINLYGEFVKGYEDGRNNFRFLDDYIDLSIYYWTKNLTKPYIPRRFPNIEDNHKPSFNYYNDNTCVTNDITGDRREPQERVEIKAPNVYPLVAIVYGYLCGAYADKNIVHDNECDVEVDKETCIYLIKTYLAYLENHKMKFPQILRDYTFSKKHLSNFYVNKAVRSIVFCEELLDSPNMPLREWLGSVFPNTLKSIDEMISIQSSISENSEITAAHYLYKLLDKENPLDFNYIGIVYSVVKKILECSQDEVEACKISILLRLVLSHQNVMNNLDEAFSEKIRMIYLSSQKIDTVYPEEILDSYGETYLKPKINNKLLELIHNKEFWCNFLESTKIPSYRLAVTMFEIGANPDKGYHRLIVDEIRILLEKVFNVILPANEELDKHLTLQSQSLLQLMFKGELSSTYMREIMEDDFFKHVLNRISEKLADRDINTWSEAAHNLYGYKDLETLLVGEFFDIVYCVFFGKSMPFDYDKISCRINVWVEKYPELLAKDLNDLNQFVYNLFTLIYKKLPLYTIPEVSEEPDEDEKHEPDVDDTDSSETEEEFTNPDEETDRFPTEDSIWKDSDENDEHWEDIDEREVTDELDQEDRISGTSREDFRDSDNNDRD